MTTLPTTNTPPPTAHLTAAQVDAEVLCESCDLDFGVRPAAEATYFAGVHNDLQHGGRPDAHAYRIDPATSHSEADQHANDQHANHQHAGDLYDGYDAGPHPAHAGTRELADEDLDGLW